MSRLFFLFTVFFAALPRLAAGEPVQDHRYLFPNGNELVFVPGQPGLRLEKAGKVITTFPEHQFEAKVFPSTDTMASWSTRVPRVYIDDVPSAKTVFFQATRRLPNGASADWILAVNQEGDLQPILFYSPMYEQGIFDLPPRPEPRWRQFRVESGGHAYIVLTVPQPGQHSTSVQISVLREDRPDVHMEFNTHSRAQILPKIVDGKLILDRSGIPDHVVEVAQALERRIREKDILTGAHKAVADLLDATKPGEKPKVSVPFAREILPSFAAGLEIAADNTDLETAQAFLALQQRHEKMIPTLVRIAKEKATEADLKPGKVNRSLLATRLLADYAELDPRALESLDKLATEAGHAKARHVAEVQAKLLRKELLSPEGQTELLKCLRGFRGLAE